MTNVIDFDAPDLAGEVERLSQYDLDNLPFGIILVDGEGTVLFYSETEQRQSGFADRPLGRNLFDMSCCFGSDDFRDRIRRAQDEGKVDLEFGWPCDFGGAPRELRIRVQSAQRGGLWLFVERDQAGTQ